MVLSEKEWALIFSEKEWIQIRMICEDRESHYNKFFILKSSGKKRMILAPDPLLKGLQKKLLNEFIYVHFIPSVFATGFIVDRSIVDNAKVHVGAKIIVNVDVKDFFPSVTADILEGAIFFKRMKNIIEAQRLDKVMKEKSISYTHQIKEEEYRLDGLETAALAEKASLLTLLVTYPYMKNVYTDDGDKTDSRVIIDALPQGAPTSPALSNAVCFEMDNMLSGVAGRNSAVYSRYADDLTFSSSENTQLNKIIPVIKEIISKYGFRANESKIHVNRRSGRMSVTGLVVNDKVSYGRGRLRILRAKLHNTKMKICKDKVFAPFDEMHFRGLAAYINSFDPGKALKMNAEIDSIVDGMKDLKGR